MPTRIIRNAEHADALVDILKGANMPLTVSWTQGAPRRNVQNRLAQRWFSDIAKQMQDRTREEVRAECKLRFGVPILCDENQAFRASYNRALGPLTYEQRAQAVMALDLPVTRLMTVKQMSRFMDNVQREYSPFVQLTDPAALKYEMEFAPC